MVENFLHCVNLLNVFMKDFVEQNFDPNCSIAISPSESFVDFPSNDGEVGSPSSVSTGFASNNKLGEHALFRAVIMQALLDSVSNSKRMEDVLEKQKAINWFSLDNPDFITVCKMADLNPHWVYVRAKKAISSGCKWRNVS